MGNSIEYISYNCVFFSYSQGHTESGGIASLFFQKGGKGAELTFHHSIIGNFMVNEI